MRDVPKPRVAEPASRYSVEMIDMLSRRRFLALVAALLGAPPTLSASDANKVPDPWLKVTLTDQEVAVIRDYYGEHPEEAHAAKKKKKLPPGLQKKLARGGQLPPGWQKKVERGEVLDANVYAHATPVPVDLVRRLPPQPEGTIIVTVEGKLVRLIEATRTILDVFDIH
jgi:hypothetical protein